MDSTPLSEGIAPAADQALGFSVAASTRVASPPKGPYVGQAVMVSRRG